MTQSSIEFNEGEEWMARAECMGRPVNVWTSPKSPEDVKAAKAVCRICPVWIDCLAYGLRLDQENIDAGFKGYENIHGGLTVEQRDQIRQARARVRQETSLQTSLPD